MDVPKNTVEYTQPNTYRMKAGGRAVKSVLKASALGGLIFALSQNIIAGRLDFEGGSNFNVKVALALIVAPSASTLLSAPIVLLLADRVLTTRRMSDRELSATLGILNRRGFSKMGTLDLAVRSLTSAVVALWVSKGLTQNARSTEVGDDRTAQANALGGRQRETYGMTGQKLIFNSSAVDWEGAFDEHPYHHAVRGASPNSFLVKIPKTPELGRYVAATSRAKGGEGNVKSASLRNVEGLQYNCTVSVTRTSGRKWESVNATTADATSQGTIKITRLDEGHTGTFREGILGLTLAFPDGQSRVVEASLDCSVLSVAGKLSFDTEVGGEVRMLYEDSRVTNLTLPPRVVGDEPSQLERAIENSVGSNSATIWVKESETSQRWLDLMSYTAAAFGIRSAFNKGFTDETKDYTAREVEVWKDFGDVSVGTSLWLIPVVAGVFGLVESFLGSFMDNKFSQISGMAGNITDAAGRRNSAGIQDITANYKFQLQLGELQETVPHVSMRAVNEGDRALQAPPAGEEPNPQGLNPFGPPLIRIFRGSLLGLHRHQRP